MKVLSHDQLNAMNHDSRSDFVLINVLSPDAFKKEHIRTSINIPKDSADFSQQVERIVGDKERPVVVYCANFDCDASEQAAKKLEASGFRHVYDYAGGTQDWMVQHLKH